MINRVLLILILTLFCQQLQADTAVVVKNDFNEGYLFSKLEDQFPGQHLQFNIQDNKLIVYEFPEDAQLCQEINYFLKCYCSYDIVFDRCYTPAPINVVSLPVDIAHDAADIEGDWLPELSPFFPTMLAQPHIVGYSAGYRTYDKVFKISCLPVSIGDQFSLYQFKTQVHGQLYFGIEACVWAIFEARAKSLSLINADYYIALPLTYINGHFSTRLRLFHQSSHLGDEFLLEHGQIERLNPSMEVVDLSIAYDFNDRLTGFVGFSKVIRSDDSYKLKQNGIYYGFNYLLDMFKIQLCNLEASPYIATYFMNLEDNDWKLDSSMAIGYQWDKLYGHKFRIFLQGHSGYSHEGQFSTKRTQYVALKIQYGY